MLRKLRRKLALICTGMTFAVFLLMIILIAATTEKQYRETNDALFRSNLDTLLRNLQEDEIKNTWLGEMEIAHRMMIAVENNGQALYFPGVWSPPSGRQPLIVRAREYARTQMQVDYSIPPLMPERAEFLLAQAGEQYRCAVALLPMRENWISLTVLSDMQLENETVRDRRVLYAGLSVGVLAILSLLSWWFTGQAVQPIGENMEKQRAFVAAASHELRSPLAVIRGSVAAMRAEPAASDRLLLRIDRVSEQMGRLVNDLLLLANSEQQSWQMNPAQVDMDILLIETVEECRDAAEKQGFSLQLDLPEKILPPVYGDRERLRQILTILIDNAVNHSKGAGEIAVRVRVQKQFVVQVIDHGVGIAQNLHDRVFDRFFCGDFSRTEKKHFGLGLSIAQELVLQHGGKIGVAQTPGGGCTFTVTLPIEKKGASSHT